MAPLEDVETAVVVVRLKNRSSSTIQEEAGSPVVVDQAGSPDSDGQGDSAWVPPDGGLVAWLQVIAGFLTSAVAWGYPSMFGVYQLYYTQTVGLAADRVAWIGATQTFLTYLMSTVSGRLSDGGFARHTMVCGAALVVVGTLATSLATAYWHMFAAQALCTGLGLGLLTAPCVTAVTGYFRRRRSVALAASTMGTSAGSALFPAVIQYLIPRVGFPWAVRCSAAVALVLCAAALVLLRPRPVAPRAQPLVDWAAFSEPPYVLFIAASFLIFWALYFGFFYVSGTPFMKDF